MQNIERFAMDIIIIIFKDVVIFIHHNTVQGN